MLDPSGNRRSWHDHILLVFVAWSVFTCYNIATAAQGLGGTRSEVTRRVGTLLAVVIASALLALLAYRVGIRRPLMATLALFLLQSGASGAAAVTAWGWQAVLAATPSLSVGLAGVFLFAWLLVPAKRIRR
jgi:hypothetical protein